MTNTELLALAKETKEKAGKATEGPWVAYTWETIKDARRDDGGFEWAKHSSWRPGSVWQKTEGGGTTGLPGSIETTAENAEFIVHARTAAPILADAVERLVEENERLLKSVSHVCSGCGAEKSDG